MHGLLASQSCYHSVLPLVCVHCGPVVDFFINKQTSLSQTIHARLLASLYLQAIVLTHYISQYVVHMIHSISLVEPNTVNCSTSSTTGHYILATRIFSEHAAMVSRLPGEFDPDREEWSSYAERIEFYLVAQGITDADKQRAVLLSACGPTMFGLLKRIVTPGSLRDYSFERLVVLAREHLNPKPSIAVLRAKFHSRRRHSGESIATFVSELKRLAEHCEFGDFDSMLRDKLVCDTGDKRIQEKLMAEAELSSVRKCVSHRHSSGTVGPQWS